MTVAAGFLVARARAGAASLAALTLVSAVAGALVVGIVGAVRAIEATSAIHAVQDASGDRDRIVVRVTSGPQEQSQRIAGVDRALGRLGVGGTLRVTSDAEGLLTLEPDPARFSGEAVITLAQRLPDLQRTLRTEGLDAQVSGGLRATLLDLVDGMQSRRGPASVALGVVAMLTVVVVAAAATEPVRTRLKERALLRARGMSKPRLVGIALAEAMPAQLLGAGIGATVGWTATWAWSGTIMPSPWAAAIALGLVLTGSLAVTVATVHGVDRRSARGDLLAGVTAVVLLAVVAGIAAWQFWETGTPVIVRGDGDATIDPLIASAPGLVMVLFALIAVVLVSPLAAAAAQIARRTRTLQPVLPLRLAARRPGRMALATGTVAFAVAALTLSLAYAGSLRALGDTPDQLRVGADVRVTSIPADADPAVLATLPGVDASMAARTLAVRGADGTFPLLGVTPATLGEVMQNADGLIDPAALGEAIRLPAMGVPVPDDEAVLAVTLRVPSGGGDGGAPGEEPAAVAVTVSVIDEAGVLTRLHASNLGLDVIETLDDTADVTPMALPERTVRLALPTPGHWRVVAVDAAQVPGAGRSGTTAVDVRVVAGDTPLDFSGFRSAGGEVEASATGLTIVTREPAWNATKPDVTRALASDVPTRFPVVLSEDLAASLDVTVGAELSLRMASFPFTLDTEVADVIEVLPGLTDASGVLADLTALELTARDELLPNEQWLSSDDPTMVVAEAERAIGGIRIAMVDPDGAATAFTTAVAFLLAAGGAVALAVIVLLLRRSRADGTARELGIFAVLGMGRRQAARIRAAEDSLSVVFGALGGIAAGLVVAWVSVPSLARAAYAGMAPSFPVSLAVPWLVFVLLIVIVMALLLAIIVSVRAPRRLAPLLREAE